MSNANALAAASSRRAGLRTALRTALAQIEAYPLERTWRPAFLTPLSALPQPRRTPLADLPGERPPVAPFGGQPLTIGAALAGLRTRKLTAADLLQAALAAISRSTKDPNAWLYVPLAAELRAEAEALDAELRAGVCRGLLHGIPLAAADLLDVIGMPIGGDRRANEGRPAITDAGSVRLLRAAGALFVAQARMNGPSRNGATPPHRGRSEEGREVGDASGAAAAAAVAKGMSLGALTPDACGSLHGAAALHGLVGYKPTFGLIPNDGAHLISWSIDQVGCVALTVEDTALLLDVLDPAPHMRYSQALFKTLRGVRIGVPPAALERVETDVAAALRAAAAAMRQAGAEVAEIETPGAEDFELAQAAALVLRRAEAAAYWAFGGRRRTQGRASPAAKQAEEAGGVSAAHYLQAQRIREDLRWRLLRPFDRCDALLLPTARADADRFGAVQSSVQSSAQSSALWSLLGFPTVSLPCGWTSSRLPVGAELVAAPYEDARLLSIAAALELASKA